MQEPDGELGAVEESSVDIDWQKALQESLDGDGAAKKDETAEVKADDATEAKKETQQGHETPIETKVEAKVETGNKSGEESAKDALQPLASWSEEVKTYFLSLDKTGQQFLLDRHKEFEGDYTKKTQEVADVRKRYERLDDVLKPYDEIARRTGTDLAPAVATALQYYVAFQRDPLSLIKTLIQANKLTAEQLGLVEDTTDPAQRALTDRLANTERTLASMQQGASQANVTQLVTRVTEFKDAKDEKGNPKYPYFDRVRTLMAPIVDAGKSLEDSYKEAVWAVPEYRQEMEKSAQVARETAHAAAEKEREKERLAKAEKERLEKLKSAKAAETLPSSDTDKGKQKTEFKGWASALQEELSSMQ